VLSLNFTNYKDQEQKEKIKKTKSSISNCMIASREQNKIKKVDKKQEVQLKHFIS